MLMENSGALKLKAVKNKTAIFQRLISGVQEAIEKNTEVHYITDLELFGTNLTYKLSKDSWVYTLDKARLFFEDLEDYEQSKVCRDIIRSLKESDKAK